MNNILLLLHPHRVLHLDESGIPESILPDKYGQIPFSGIDSLSPHCQHEEFSKIDARTSFRHAAQYVDGRVKRWILLRYIKPRIAILHSGKMAIQSQAAGKTSFAALAR